MARRSLEGFARLAGATTVVTLVLVALVGTVRATNSGLACPTYPGCFGFWDFLPPADVNVWLEHSHRLLAGVVGFMILGLAVWAVARFRDRGDLVWPAVGALLAVGVQAALGAFVVLRQLMAELVTAHLGMSMAVVALLALLTVNARREPGPRAALDPAGRRLARTSAAVAALTYLQILVGGHVSGVGAGLAFVDRPWLGVVALGPIERDIDAWNVAHRVLAVVVVVAIGVLVRAARGQAGWLRLLPHIASGLVVLQVLLGVANLWTGLSFLTVIPHLAVASWIWTALVLHAILARDGGAPRRDREPAAPEPALALGGR